jgi:hypothetical protein
MLKRYNNILSCFKTHFTLNLERLWPFVCAFWCQCLLRCVARFVPTTLSARMQHLSRGILALEQETNPWTCPTYQTSAYRQMMSNYVHDIPKTRGCIIRCMWSIVKGLESLEKASSLQVHFHTLSWFVMICHFGSSLNLPGRLTSMHTDAMSEATGDLADLAALGMAWNRSIRTCIRSIEFCWHCWPHG